MSLVFSLVIGFLLAALLDQKIRFEDTFRTIFLYPFALSFIVTGLVWQWLLNPDFGIQEVVRDLGWTSFSFDPLYDSSIVIYGISDRRALARHRAHHVPDAGRPARHRRGHLEGGAGRRHPDVEDLSLHRHPDDAAGASSPRWSSSRAGIVKVYDLVVAQTSGGPGIASEVPAKYVYDYMFVAQNLGQGFAASTMMLLSVVIVIVPWAYLEFGGEEACLTSAVSLPRRHGCPAGAKRPGRAGRNRGMCSRAATSSSMAP